MADLHVPIVLKSGSLNLLEPSGPVQVCFMFNPLWNNMAHILTVYILRFACNFPLHKDGKSRKFLRRMEVNYRERNRVTAEVQIKEKGYVHWSVCVILLVERVPRKTWNTLLEEHLLLYFLQTYCELWTYMNCPGCRNGKLNPSYSRSNYIKSPASSAGNVSERRPMSHAGRVHEVVCA